MKVQDNQRYHSRKNDPSALILYEIIYDYNLMITEREKLFCPQCSNILNSPLIQHLLSNCSRKQDIIKQTGVGLWYSDGTRICRRCQKQFLEKEWIYHCKKIAFQCKGFKTMRQLEKLAAKKNIDDRNQSYIENPGGLSIKAQNKAQINVQSTQSLFNTVLFPQNCIHTGMTQYKKQISADEQLMLFLIDILTSTSKIPLLHWIRKNRKVSLICLQRIFQQFINKMLSNLDHAIEKPTFELFQSKFKMKWKQIFSEPDDIFNKDIVLDAVKNLKVTRKNRVLAALNSIYKQIYSDIFPRFAIQPIRNRIKRKQPPLKTEDLFIMLQKLMRTKQRDLVHIAIDLYLLFQSGQRIFSDRQRIESSVFEMIQKRKQHKKYSQITMKISKTGNQGVLILSEQLCQLLQLFKWKNFYRNANLYRRIKKITNFPIYSIKKTLFTEMTLQKANYLNINLKKLANHKSHLVTQIYAKSGTLNNEKYIKDELVIPNLIICTKSRQQFLKFIGNTNQSFIYAKVYTQWMLNLKKVLRVYDKSQVNFYQQNNQAYQKSFENIELNQSQSEPISMQIQQQSQCSEFSKEQIAPQNIRIDGLEYSFQNGVFKLHELFKSISEVTLCLFCNISSINQGKQCIFCRGNYHDNCLPKFCSCILYKSPYKGIQFTSQIASNLKIQMPKRYIGENRFNRQQIIFLLALKRLRYINCAVLDREFKADSSLLNNCKAQKLVMNQFQEYQNGNYFPPISLKKNGNQQQNGADFGLYSTQNIERYCFIGQYAADIVLSINAIVIKKPEYIFTLLSGNRPQNTIIIGPSINCGHCALINRVSYKEANCLSKIVQVNGKLRIIIYTTKFIKKGDQLLLNIKEENTELFKHGQSKIQQLKTVYIPKTGLYNANNMCYINSVLQFLRILLYQQIIQNCQSQTDKCLKKIMKMIKENVNSIINPQQQIQNLLNSLNYMASQQKQFTKYKQADAHQFLLSIINKMPMKTRKKLEFTAKSTLKCLKCSTISQSAQYFLTLEVSLGSKNVFQKLFQVKQQQITYNCQTCNSQRHNKKTQFLSFPQILIINLKRFTKQIQKIKTLINLQQIPNYKLLAQITHIGDTIYNGHYITKEYDENGIWVLNDSKVQIKDKCQYSSGYIFGFKKKI